MHVEESSRAGQRSVEFSWVCTGGDIERYLEFGPDGNVHLDIDWRNASIRVDQRTGTEIIWSGVRRRGKNEDSKGGQDRV
jgi:hypothetical protein